MQDLFILALVAVTSAPPTSSAGGASGSRPAGSDRRLSGLLECVGLVVLFLLGNHALGIAAIVAARAVTGGFVSLYLIDDVTLGVLSLLQALAFAWWRHTPTGRR